jgi:hypothetical protein
MHMTTCWTTLLILIVHNRPHSRIGLRPRHSSHESSPDEKRPDSRQGVRQHAAMRYTSPYDDEPRVKGGSSPVSSRRRGRSSDPSFRPPGSADSNMRRARSAEGLRQSGNAKHQWATVRQSADDNDYGYLHSTASFNSYRKKVRNSFDLSRFNSPDKKKPFYPNSFSIDALRSGNRSASASRDRSRRSVDNGVTATIHLNSEGRRRRDTHSHSHSRSGGKSAKTKSRQSFTAPTAVSTQRTAMTRRESGRRELCSNGDRKTKKSSTSQSRHRKPSSDATQIVKEVGQSMMRELSKVVDVVSSDLRVVSRQLQTLSTSMSDSVMAANASRDMSRSYGGTHQGANRSYDTSDIIGCGDDEVEVMQSSNHRRSKSASRHGTSPAKPSASTDKAKSSPYSSSGTATAAFDSSTQSDSDRILTEMIQDGIRKKLLHMMRDSLD